MGIRDHKEEVKRYLDAPIGTKIWERLNNGDWVLCDEVSWNKDLVYIVDDIWAKLRKAIIDGETIDYYDIELKGWHPIDVYDRAWILKDPLPDMSIYDYRIRDREWYEVIPKEGIWCFVWDNKLKHRRIEEVFNYTVGDRYPFKTKYDGSYMNAQPLDPQPIFKEGNNE